MNNTPNNTTEKQPNWLSRAVNAVKEVAGEAGYAIKKVAGETRDAVSGLFTKKGAVAGASLLALVGAADPANAQEDPCLKPTVVDAIRKYEVKKITEGASCPRPNIDFFTNAETGANKTLLDAIPDKCERDVTLIQNVNDLCGTDSSKGKPEGGIAPERGKSGGEPARSAREVAEPLDFEEGVKRFVLKRREVAGSLLKLMEKYVNAKNTIIENGQKHTDVQGIKSTITSDNKEANDVANITASVPPQEIDRSNRVISADYDEMTALLKELDDFGRSNPDLQCNVGEDDPRLAQAKKALEAARDRDDIVEAQGRVEALEIEKMWECTLAEVTNMKNFIKQLSAKEMLDRAQNSSDRAAAKRYLNIANNEIEKNPARYDRAILNITAAYYILFGGDGSFILPSRIGDIISRKIGKGNVSEAIPALTAGFGTAMSKGTIEGKPGCGDIKVESQTFEFLFGADWRIQLTSWLRLILGAEGAVGQRNTFTLSTKDQKEGVTDEVMGRVGAKAGVSFEIPDTTLGLDATGVAGFLPTEGGDTGFYAGPSVGVNVGPLGINVRALLERWYSKGLTGENGSKGANFETFTKDEIFTLYLMGIIRF